MIGFIGNQCHFDIEILYDITDAELWVELPKLSKLYTAVNSHADMICCQVGNRLVIEPSLYDQVLTRYPALKDTLLKGQTELTAQYPGNIAYNVAFIGEYAVHNTSYTDPALKRLIDKQGYKWIHTKQGYSNCMCLPVGDRAAVTSDAGLAKTLQSYNIDVLLISQGYIDLPDLNYGFIGGASILVNDCIHFVGDIDEHPDSDEITTFISEHNMKYKCIKKGNLIDIGSARLVNQV